MCGIAGFIDLQSSTSLSAERRGEVLDRMCRVISHRGPDDQGTMLEPGVALGMRRLSIIDVAGGHQPISGENGDVTIVFNGEIYNYRDLVPELEQLGHTFRTRSDTEAIVHAYEQFGPECVSRLRGMFAFAIWDKRSRELFIARDRVGKKPLYYSLLPNGALIFGSELKCLLEHPEVKTEVNLEAVDAYFTLGYVPDPLSIFVNINKLPPGHYLIFKDGKVKVEQYWDFKFDRVASITEEECAAEVRRLLDESVKIRLVSEVPLGAFLSGGVDSSTVVGLMAGHMSQPVKTFSIGFNEDSYSELKFARLTAEKFGTDHHEFFVTPEICDVVDDLVRHFDEPFADSSAIPTFMVSKLARQHVTVALSGDGGDELFAGYTRYAIEKKREVFAKVPAFLRQGIMQPVSRRLPHNAKGRNFIHNVALEPADRFLDSMSIFTSLNKELLYAGDMRQFLKRKNRFVNFQELADKVKTGSPTDELLYIDSKTYLPGDILTKVDRMSMAASLEARAPLLDHKLIDFVTAIPAAMKLKNLETKYIMKKAVADLVPHEILYRPKQGFGVPIQEWINSQLRSRIREELAHLTGGQRDYIDQKYVQVLLDEHERGRRDHSMSLWALFMFQLWHREYVDNTTGAQASSPARCGKGTPS
ncbi:MAG TPA: asparagine synthase (glutamine-hydrolyzing) [Pyrinomonadaceae bacterium]